MLAEIKFISKSIIEKGILPDAPNVPDIPRPVPPASGTSPGHLRPSRCHPCTSDDEEPDQRVCPHLSTKAELKHIDNFIEALDSNNLYSLTVRSQELLAKHDFLTRLNKLQQTIPESAPSTKSPVVIRLKPNSADEVAAALDAGEHPPKCAFILYLDVLRPVSSVPDTTGIVGSWTPKLLEPLALT